MAIEEITSEIKKDRGVLKAHAGKCLISQLRQVIEMANFQGAQQFTQ
jgi:hypothetical protein